MWTLGRPPKAAAPLRLGSALRRRCGRLLQVIVIQLQILVVEADFGTTRELGEIFGRAAQGFAQALAFLVVEAFQQFGFDLAPQTVDGGGFLTTLIGSLTCTRRPSLGSS